MAEGGQCLLFILFRHSGRLFYPFTLVKLAHETWRSCSAGSEDRHLAPGHAAASLG
jgi:hypothetical protein